MQWPVVNQLLWTEWMIHRVSVRAPAPSTSSYGVLWVKRWCHRSDKPGDWFEQWPGAMFAFEWLNCWHIQQTLLHFIITLPLCSHARPGIHASSSVSKMIVFIACYSTVFDWYVLVRQRDIKRVEQIGLDFSFCVEEQLFFFCFCPTIPLFIFSCSLWYGIGQLYKDLSSKLNKNSL